MIIIAFDPGHSTGIAVLDDTAISMLTTVSTGWIFTQGFLQTVLAQADPDLIVMEALPTQNVDPLTIQVFNKIYSVVDSNPKHKNIARFIKPGLWKPVAARWNKTKGDREYAEHAKDALGLARYSAFTVGAFDNDKIK